MSFSKSPQVFSDYRESLTRVNTQILDQGVSGGRKILELCHPLQLY